MHTENFHCLPGFGICCEGAIFVRKYQPKGKATNQNNAYCIFWYCLSNIFRSLELKLPHFMRNLWKLPTIWSTVDSYEFSLFSCEILPLYFKEHCLQFLKHAPNYNSNSCPVCLVLKQWPTNFLSFHFQSNCSLNFASENLNSPNAFTCVHAIHHPCALCFLLRRFDYYLHAHRQMYTVPAE